MSDLVKEGEEFLRKLDELGRVKRRWVSKDEEDTDPRYGYPPYRRPIDLYIRKGLIVIDKPPGPTSHEVVAWIKKMFGLEKAGHGGTLEPAHP